MTEFGNNHPCAGKDCRDCETCIFDEDLFIDKVQPNKRKDIMVKKLCNLCPNLKRSYENRDGGRFDAACKVVTFKALDEVRARRIDYNLTPSQDIPCPSWCPIYGDKKPLGLPTQSQVTSKPNPNTPTREETLEEIKKKPISQLTYSEKRELMKGLPKHIDWDDIEEGKTYVIPKILSQSRKIIKVYTKTETCCSCHEISEYTGQELSYTCNVYPTDLDAVFISEIHNF